MTAHAAHRVHDNSRISFAALDLAARKALVLNVYLLAGCPLTDRDVAQRLGTQDMNACRPRITECLEDGLLWQTGSESCAVTGRTVRVCMPTAKARSAS